MAKKSTGLDSLELGGEIKKQAHSTSEASSQEQKRVPLNLDKAVYMQLRELALKEGHNNVNKLMRHALDLLFIEKGLHTAEELNSDIMG